MTTKVRVLKTKIGDTREVDHEMAPGLYPSDEDPGVIYEVLETVTVKKIEEFSYKYENIKEEPGWHFKKYILPKELFEESPKVEPVLAKLSWWRRLFGRKPKLPEMRVLT